MLTATRNNAINLAQRIFSYYDNSQVFSLNFTGDKLVAIIREDLYESLIEGFSKFENISFEKNLTATSTTEKHSFFLVEWIAFDN